MQSLSAYTGPQSPFQHRLSRVWTPGPHRSGLKFDRFVGHGNPLKCTTVGIVLIGYRRSTAWRCSAVSEEDFLQANDNIFLWKADQVEENIHHTNDPLKKDFFLMIREKHRGCQILPFSWSFREVSVVLVNVVLVGLMLCPQALAGTEVLTAEATPSSLGDLGDIKSGFASAFLLIFFSEIGDKTFFIAALLASRKSNAAVFTGTFGALVAMTFISVFLGRTFHYIDGILPFSLGENELPLDDLAAVILLVYFGVSTLLEAAAMEGSKAEEEQQEAELAIAGIGADGAGLQAVANTALATFALVFVAEWGDKSFFSTVALSAASSPFGVVLGAIAGHGVATVLAVLGGSFLSTYISEKAIAYTGGILFLIFAIATLVEIVS